MDEARTPYAMTPPSLILARAIVRVCERDDWYNLPVPTAAGIMVQDSGGRLLPKVCREAFCSLVREAGLLPIEE